MREWFKRGKPSDEPDRDNKQRNGPRSPLEKSVENEIDFNQLQIELNQANNAFDAAHIALYPGLFADTRELLEIARSEKLLTPTQLTEFEGLLERAVRECVRQYEIRCRSHKPL